MKNTEIDQIPTADLWLLYQQSKDPEVRNELVVQYSYIVKCIALKTVGRYQYFNYMDDIINEGLIALLDAVEKFDTEKKAKFETYASIKVRGAMVGGDGSIRHSWLDNKMVNQRLESLCLAGHFFA